MFSRNSAVVQHVRTVAAGSFVERIEYYCENSRLHSRRRGQYSHGRESIIATGCRTVIGHRVQLCIVGRTKYPFDKHRSGPRPEFIATAAVYRTEWISRADRTAETVIRNTYARIQYRI